MGFREDLVIVANKGFSKIIVEGDCLQVVNALAQAGNSFSDYSSILSDCLHLLPLFSSCEFVHVKRFCNMVAHSLAKQSLFSGRLEFWGVQLLNGWLILAKLMLGLRTKLSFNKPILFP